MRLFSEVEKREKIGFIFKEKLNLLGSNDTKMGGGREVLVLGR